MMYLELLIPIVGIILNIILSSVMPCMIKKTNQPFFMELKKAFLNNKQVIFASSLIVGVIIYCAIKISIKLDDIFNVNNINDIDTEEIFVKNIPSHIMKDLIRLF